MVPVLEVSNFQDFTASLVQITRKIPKDEGTTEACYESKSIEYTLLDKTGRRMPSSFY